MTTPLTPIPSRVRDLKGDVSQVVPTDGQALVWDSDASQWVPAARLAPDGDGSQLTGITQGQVAGLTLRLDAIDQSIEDVDVATIVRTSGSYADPSWIISLAGSKIIGDIGGNAASITGSIAQSKVTNLPSDLALKAPLASPALTGTPTAPTATTGTNTTQLATCAFVAVVDAAAVHKSGAETIAGTKTFSSRPTFSVGLTAPMGLAANNNEAVGAGALVAVGASTGVNNTAIGQAAGQSITTGNNNTVVGRAAMASATTGVSSSVAFGYSSDVGKTTGSGTTALGASTSTAGFTNATAVGYQATCTASNQVMLGTASETVNMPGKAIVAGWLQLGTSTDAAIPNGGIAWSLTNPNVLKVRDPSGTLKVVTLT